MTQGLDLIGKELELQLNLNDGLLECGDDVLVKWNKAVTNGRSGKCLHDGEFACPG